MTTTTHSIVGAVSETKASGISVTGTELTDGGGNRLEGRMHVAWNLFERNGKHALCSIGAVVETIDVCRFRQIYIERSTFCQICIGRPTQHGFDVRWQSVEHWL